MIHPLIRQRIKELGKSVGRLTDDDLIAMHDVYLTELARRGSTLAKHWDTICPMLNDLRLIGKLDEGVAILQRAEGRLYELWAESLGLDPSRPHQLGEF